jgi:hypothetical protein
MKGEQLPFLVLVGACMLAVTFSLHFASQDTKEAALAVRLAQKDSVIAVLTSNVDVLTRRVNELDSVAYYQDRWIREFGKDYPWITKRIDEDIADGD